MPKIHPGATLTPHFRDFLRSGSPGSRGTRVRGNPRSGRSGSSGSRIRLGVGIETHLVTDGSVVYQAPMTYRRAPLAESVPVSAAADSLIAVAEHSVLGTRWIYDGTADPVWAAELIRLTETETTATRSSRTGAGQAHAHGRRLTTDEFTVSTAAIEVIRVLAPGRPPSAEPGLAGVVMGTWPPKGSEGAVESGLLAVVRTTAGRGT
ncbi:MAG TPA: hypothetical protein VFQ44_20400 [Streptosporangiaceae bacterium]|nr:hypothetical protein [Streptosporangiaceae bacterium]